MHGHFPNPLIELEVAIGVGEGAVNGRLRLGEDAIKHLAKARKELQGTKVLGCKSRIGFVAKCGQVRLL